jgi:ribosomal protein S12 methylthiotransferase
MGSPVQVRPACISFPRKTNAYTILLRFPSGAKPVPRADKTYYLESLGCNKNTVDSEILMTLLRERGFRRVEKPEKADRIIVNTCAFIDEAKKESIETILDLAHMKKPRARLVVTGCFPQIHADEIEAMMPEADVITGSANLSAVADAIESEGEKRDYPLTRIISKTHGSTARRTDFLSSAGFAYLKISEGCSRACSYCLIPVIKGRLRSRMVDEVADEARDLERRGVKELILVSQDTLGYGSDIGGRFSLKSLLARITAETSIPRIRLLYLRPGKALMSNLDLFESERVLPYFDIPIQHVSKSILRNMNREGDGHEFEEAIIRIRERFPNAVLRTTVMTGFPGEGETEFEELLSFIDRVKFNHLGVFVFSPQRGTEAFHLRDRVKTRIAEKRRDTLLARQKAISRSLLQGEIGKDFDVLIEEQIQDDERAFGRSYHFAPEVDGVFVVQSSRENHPGCIIRARVTRADDYDLHGIEMRTR